MTHKYTTSFSSVVRCIVDDEKDKYFSKASLDALQSIIPAEFSSQIDLLPIAFNACVINRANKNDDLIDTATAVKIYKKFIHKPIDLEHNRQMIVGHLVNAGFSKFDMNYAVGAGSEILGEEVVAKMNDPFNICLAGIIYKVVGENLSEEIQNSTDPNNPRYLSISASWELGFDDYVLVAGSKDLTDCRVITDKAEIEKLSPNLRTFGGKGRLDDGSYLFRKLSGEVTPLGIGLTKSPAADVQGIVTASISDQKPQNNENNSSQLNKTNVKDSSMKIIAKLEDLKQVTQETVSEYSFASISETIEKAMKEANEKWTKEINAEKQNAADALKKATDLEAKFTAVSTELDGIKAEQAKAAALQKFNDRMAHIDETYTLTEDEKKVVATQIKDLDDTKFEAWVKDFEVLAGCKKKSKGAEKCKHGKDPASCPECKDEMDAKAKADAALAAQQALASAKPDGKGTLPNAAGSQEPSLIEKYSKAFQLDSLIITK